MSCDIETAMAIADIAKVYEESAEEYLSEQYTPEERNKLLESLGLFAFTFLDSYRSNNVSLAAVLQTTSNEAALKQFQKITEQNEEDAIKQLSVDTMPIVFATFLTSKMCLESIFDSCDKEEKEYFKETILNTIGEEYKNLREAEEG